MSMVLEPTGSTNEPVRPDVLTSRPGPVARVLRNPFIRRFFGRRLAVVALIYLLLIVLVAFIGPWITPYPPDHQDLAQAFAAPFSPGHFLGTDQLGRDVLSRLIAADRVALIAAGQALGIAMLVGIPLGVVAGYFGGITDRIVMRVTDAVQSLPPLIIAIGIVGALGPGLTNAMLALGLIFAPNFVRIVRAAILEVREETFIEASRSIGTPAIQVLYSRIAPNVFPPVLVQISLVAGFSLTAEAALSLLGLGAQPPVASWGSMLSQGYNSIYQQPWLVVFPGLAIAVAVLAFNLVGDGLRDSIAREK